MDKATFVTQLERGASSLSGQPVTTAVLRELAGQLKAGDPEWWKLTQKAWADRPFVAWNEAWGLFMTAMHFEALKSEECPLVPYFPSCGGTDEADPSSGVARFLRDAPDSFYERLRVGHRRSFVAPLAQAWPALGGLFFQTRQLPYYVVEASAGGGLNLCVDSKIPAMSQFISARIGLDEKPLVLEDLEDRRWLTAALLPDSAARIAELDTAIEAALENQRRDPNYLQLVKCPADKGPRFAAKNIPSDDEDVGLMFLNVGVTSRMTDAAYQAYAKDVIAMMKPWGERALWVEVERVRGELYSNTFEVRAARFAGEAPVQKTLFRLDAAQPEKPNFVDAAKFLHTAGALPLEEVLKLLPA